MMRFCKELVRAERNNWTECYSGSLKEKLKLAIEPEHHSFFEPVAYQVSERIYTATKYDQTKAGGADAGNYGSRKASMTKWSGFTPRK